MTKRVAIIGAGCSGLAAIKTCLDEGLRPTCFESSNDIGGLWRFSDHVTEDRGCVMRTTIINTSKEMMAFSDFPPPKEFPNFMHHSMVLEYYRLYAKRFNLTNHIQFNSEIQRIQPMTSPHLNKRGHSNGGISCNNNKLAVNNNNNNDSFDCACSCSFYQQPMDGKGENRGNTFAHEDRKLNHNAISMNAQNMGGDLQAKHSKDLPQQHILKRSESDVNSSRGYWAVIVKDKISGISTIHHFDAVLICTGHHGQINMPKIQGRNSFKGKILHSRDLRHVDQLHGFRHMVVGIGNSACDVAVELSHRGKVFLSTHRGAWIMQRLQAKGLPADVAYLNRLVFSILYSLPHCVLNKLVAWALNQKLDHDLYGLRPTHGPIAAHPTVNDELPNRIACGQVTVKTNVERLQNMDVYFKDGTVEKDIDNIVLATGYKMGFSFLDTSFLSCEDNEMPLYLYMFPSHLSSPTLAVIGCVQPGGAIGPVAEMQCRLAARVFLGKVQLPGKSAMEKDIKRRREANAKRYVTSPRHTVQVDYIPYLDELASWIGCKPRLGPLLISDPRLALQCLLGPCTTYQYRLQGPGLWPEARQAIMKQMERVKYPLATRKLLQASDQPEAWCWRLLILSALIVFCLATLVFH